MSLSVPEYVSTALRWLEDEKRWGQKYYKHSYKKVIKIVEKEIIYEVAYKLATNEESGVKDMLWKRSR